MIHQNYEFVDSHTQRANILKELRRASDSIEQHKTAGSSPSMLDRRAGMMGSSSRRLEQERIPLIGGTDFLAYGKGCVISMHERQKVLAASNVLYDLIADSLTARGESPTLISLLAHFKLSDRGKLHLHWATAVLSVPSESLHVRTFAPGEEETRRYQEALQAVSLDSSCFLRFANLQADARKNVLKSLDHRAVSMDLSEWFHFLRVLKLLPARLTKEEATDLFRRANSKTSEDDDVNEMNFIEFKRALRFLAALLQLDWEPVELAGRLAHLLLHRRFFQQNASGAAGEQTVTVSQFLSLLEEQQILRSELSRDDVLAAIKQLVQRGSPPPAPPSAGRQSAMRDQESPRASSKSEGNRILRASLDEATFREALVLVGQQMGVRLLLPSVTIDSSFARKMLEGYLRDVSVDATEEQERSVLPPLPRKRSVPFLKLPALSSSLDAAAHTDRPRRADHEAPTDAQQTQTARRPGDKVEKIAPRLRDTNVGRRALAEQVAGIASSSIPGPTMALSSSARAGAAARMAAGVGQHKYHSALSLEIALKLMEGGEAHRSVERSKQLRKKVEFLEET